MEYKKYNVSKESILDSITNLGVAVIEDVVTPEFCTDTIRQMFEWLKKYVGISQNDTSTWKEIRKLFPKHGGLIQNWGISQTQFVWNVRQYEKIYDIFASIWGEDLKVSFDGINITLDPKVTNSGYERKAWYHMDQGKNKRGLLSIQGFLNLRDVNDGNATLAILEQSNKYHDEFFEAFPTTTTDDFLVLTDEHIQWYINKGCRKTAVKCPAGSFVMWDSRTIHYGRGYDKTNTNSRFVIYVCMLSTKYFSDNILEKRKKWFQEKRMTNHWGMKLFPRIPRTYGATPLTIVDNDTIELTELGKRLI